MRQFAVIGLGRFGMSIALTLAEKGHQVLAVDSDEEIVQSISDKVLQAICMDATDPKALKSIGVSDVDVAVCGIGANIESSILVTLNLKEMGLPVIVAKAINEEHRKILEKIGASRVVLPEREMGVRVANSLVSTKVVEYIELSDRSGIVDLIPPRDFIGKSLSQINVRAAYGVNVIAIKKKKAAGKNGAGDADESVINVSPQADDIINEGDVLVVLGSNEHIEALKKIH